MSTSKQDEKQNSCYRYSRLLLEVAPLVLRKLLVTRAVSQHNVATIDDVLADTTVSKTLKHELVEIKVLRQDQLDLLYPPDGDDVDINKWDISLLCVLLKNICTLSPQEMGYVERIRIIRNSTYEHISEASLPNKDYTAYWTDLSSAIDDIVIAINDQRFLKKTNDLVTSLIHQRESDLLEEIVKTWQQDEDDFVLTRACKNAQRQLETSNITTLTGVFGSGKSCIAHHIALALREQGYTIYPVDRANDIVKYGDISSKQVFVLDDPVGKYEVDWSELRQFEQLHKTITSLTSRDVKLILTCRKNIMNDETYLSCKTVIGMGLVDLTSDENRLSEDEQRCLFEKYAKQTNISTTDVDIIVKKSYPNFPLLCKDFAANSAKFGKRPIKYFSEPFSVLLKELNTIKQRELYQYCSLVLCLVFQNSFDVKCLDVRSEKFNASNEILRDVMCKCGLSKDEPLKKIEQAFKSLIDVYFIQEKTCFRFIHGILFDVVSYQFGTDYPCEMLQYCKSNFIREHVRTAGVNTADELVILIKEQHYEELIKRFYSDLNNGDFHDVFLNPSLSDDRFVKAFSEHTKGLGTDGILKVYFRTEQNLEKYKSAKLKSECRWTKRWRILRLLENGNTRAIHWVMAYDMFEIFRACYATVKTFQTVHKNDKLSRFKDFVTRILGHEQYDENSCILIACLGGNVDMLTLLLQDNFKLTPTSVWCIKDVGIKYNALNMAAISGNIDMVRMVINEGIDINSCVEGWECTALYLSAALGYTNMCKYLLQAGANVHLCNNAGSSPLHLAAQERHTDTLNVLLQAGANVHLCNDKGASPLCIAACKGQTDTLNVMLQAGADVNLCDNDGLSALNAAAYNGHSATVSVLLQAGADVNLCHKNGLSALIVAAYNGHSATVSVLLQAGADVNYASVYNALIAAAYNGHSATVSVLLQAGADVNLCTASYGTSALFVAAQKGHSATASVLLQAGADVNLCNKKGGSALFVAAQNGHSATVSVLLQAGADVNLCTASYGTSALVVAAQNGHSATASVLLQAGADVNLCDSRYRISPLHISAYKGHLAVVKLLIEAGADVNAVDKFGQSAGYVARDENHDDIAQLLPMGQPPSTLGTINVLLNGFCPFA